MPSPALVACLFAAFAGASLAIVEPALDGPFLSDDHGYVLYNPYVHELSAGNLAAILDPGGQPAVDTLNYAPVHLLAHALEWSLFGPDVTGYHVVNAVLHALAALLFGLLLRSRGAPGAASLLAAVLFLTHPACVEAVAWISQLKTVLALVLALGALLAHPRTPAVAIGLFALAFLTKATALFALPVAAAFAWVAPPGDPWRRRAPWLAGWAVLAGAYAVQELFLFSHLGQEGERLHRDLLVNARTLFAIGARYGVMAATSFGVSALHEPPPARSWLDPWWLAGLLLFVGLTVRAAVSLARRREEAAWWIWAAAAYAPVSQVLPFLYPMADRYLYFVLPGLAGAAVFALGAPLAQLRRRAEGAHPTRRPAAFAPHALAGGAALLAVAFAVESYERAGIWRSPALLALDAARHYPDGTAAHTLDAQRAAAAGDAAGAVRALRAAFERGYDRFMDLEQSPRFDAIRNTPEFRDLLRDMAADWIATSEAKPTPTQSDLRWRARAHVTRGELETAAALYERALALEGPLDVELRAELLRVRGAIARQNAGARPSPVR